MSLFLVGQVPTGPHILLILSPLSLAKKSHPFFCESFKFPQNILMTSKDRLLKPHLDYPLVNCHITMERSTIFNGKIHYKWPFSIAFCRFTRGYWLFVTSLLASHFRPMIFPEFPSGLHHVSPILPADD